jgi:hypothetical protein
MDCNELSGYVKGTKILDKLGHSRLSRRESSCNYFQSIEHVRNAEEDWEVVIRTVAGTSICIKF